MNKIVIGIDQSYKNTGVTVNVNNGEKLKVFNIYTEKMKNNSEKRKEIRNKISAIVNKVKSLYPDTEVVCIVERIRLQSQGFLNFDYIKGIGALNAIIVDIMYDKGIEVYSVDTRSWKSAVVGTSKPLKNDFGVPEEKWPTVKWCINKGFIKSILIDMSDTRKNKGTFIDPKTNKKMMFNNDAADSAAISMFWFLGDRNKLKIEK